MTVGNSIRKAIDDCNIVELESAIMHACNAVDGTAKKAYPSIQGNKKRFTKLLRDNYDILGVMGAPGVNLTETVFPLGQRQDEDIADIIYRVHRCTHGHGDELPEGFELIAGDKPPLINSLDIDLENGRIRLNYRIIFGLLAVAAFSPVNKDQKVPEGYYLSLYVGFMINSWWGRATDFRKILKINPPPSTKIDFSEWEKARHQKRS